MSVIFKTLEKVRSPSPGEKEGGRRLRRSRNIYSFRNMVISPLGVLCLAVLLILAALFSTTYGVNFFGNYFSGDHKEPMLSETRHPLYAAVDERAEHQARQKATHPETPVNPRGNTPVKDLPQPPADIPVEEVELGRLYLPSSNLKNTPRPLASDPQYSPPKSQTRLEEPPGESEETMGRSSLPMEGVLTGNHPENRAYSYFGGKSLEEESRALTEGVSTHGQPPAGDVHMSYAPASGEEPTRSGDGIGVMEQGTVTFQPNEGLLVAPGVARDGDTASSVNPQDERMPVLSARLHQDRLVVSDLMPSASLNAKENKAARAERTYQVNLEKAAKAGRMVSKIERSMIEGDMDGAKALIDQLAQLKGEQNAYLLKLRAVWHMRQKDYDSAAGLLTKVLEKKKDDLEAGINMAIIEIKTHRLDEARRRLAGLQEIYQANTLIPELIRETGG
jgi:hypothetical protein